MNNTLENRVGFVSIDTMLKTLFGVLVISQILFIIMSDKWEVSLGLGFNAEVFFGVVSWFGTPTLMMLASGTLPAHLVKKMLYAIPLGIGLSIAAIVTNNTSASLPMRQGAGLLAAGPSIILLGYFIKDALQKNGQQLWIGWYWRICALNLLLTLFILSALYSSIYFLPTTYDYVLYKADLTLGPLLAGEFNTWIVESPLLRALTDAGYQALGAAMLVTIALTIRYKIADKIHIWRYVLYINLVTFVCYAFLPVMGPLYIFQDFPYMLPEATELPGLPAVQAPNLRNGVPSLHFGGSLLVLLLCSLFPSKLPKILAGVLVTATLWATLAKGEHYLLDLIIALPFFVCITTAACLPSSLLNRSRLSALFYLTLVLFVSWMVGLRYFPQAFYETALVTATLSVLSLVLGIMGFREIVKQLRIVVNSPIVVNVNSVRIDAAGERGLASEAFKTKNPSVKLAGVLFFLSGFTGLLYEVVFSKALALTFGGTALANYTVLATYMGGMAIGSWLGGYLADSKHSALKLYAIIELLIGVYALGTPLIFKLIQIIYVTLGADIAPDANSLTILRVSLGALALGIPTILMGISLPLMIRHVRSKGVATGQSIANLYSANIFGAALGSLAGAYFILPFLGKMGTTFGAGLFSIVIAFIAYKYYETEETTPASALRSKFLEINHTLRPSKLVIIAALAALGLGGALTLILEVIYIHLLSIVAGNSVYAFGLMLFAFLLGLGLGATAAKNLIKLKWTELSIICLSQIGLVVSVAVSTHVWDGIPTYFMSFATFNPKMDFAARELVRAVVCLVAMIPTAFWIGMAYPSAMTILAAASTKSENRGVGYGAMINTLGNIAGVFIGGFLLLPLFGALASLKIVIFVALGLSVLSLLAWSRAEARPIAVRQRGLSRRNTAIGFATVAATAALVIPAQTFDYDDLTSGSNVYFSSSPWGKYVEHVESVSGGLTSVSKLPDGSFNLLTNGKFQGNNSAKGEMTAQVGFAMAPLLHTAKRQSALVLGYGTGVTARVLNEAGFAIVDIAELTKDIITLSDKYFSNVNGNVLKRPNVNLFITDGRNYLLMNERKYDLISIEITSIWFAGAANLYNKDFYKLAKTKMQDSGVLQQWLQLHHISSTDIVYVLGSIRSEFKYVWLYMIGGQGIIVASNNPDATPGRPEHVNKISSTKSLDAVLKDHFDLKGGLERDIILTPLGVDQLLTKIDPSLSSIVSTDNNLFLEYSTPKGNALLGDTVGNNLKVLRSARDR